MPTAEEQILAGIWARTIGIVDVGPDDDFFALGGDSLTALTAVGQVRAAFQMPLSIGEFVNRPTVSAVADLVRRDAGLVSSPSSVVEIVPAVEDRPSVYVVHAEDALSIVSLLRRLTARHPIGRGLYALRSAGLQPDELPLSTVPEMAARYVRDLRQTQPEGPYLVGGYSMGGAIAFEMARLLRGAGEDVGLLLLECEPPAVVGEEPPRRRTLEEICLEHWRMLQERYEVEDVEVKIDELLVDEWAATLVFRLTPASTKEQFFRGRLITCLNLYAAQEYRAEPAPIPGLFVATTGSQREEAQRAAERWQRLLCGELSIRTVPGEHFDVLVQPELAAVLRDGLEG
jgi:thioesterase domain-containing protein